MHKICLFILPMLFFLFSNGCKNNPSDSPENKEQSVLQGKIDGWNLGDKYHISFMLVGSNDFKIWDSCKIDASGNFSFNPPIPVDRFTAPVTERFPGNTQISNNTVRITFYNPRLDIYYFKNSGVAYGYGDLRRTNNLNNLPDTSGIFYTNFVYVTGNVTIKGYDSSLYSYEKLVIYYDMNFQKGWNRLCEKYITWDTSGYVIGKYSDEPAGAKWIIRKL